MFNTANARTFGYYSASVYSTPIFTTCCSETRLDVVFSSISRSFKVVLCHACLSHSNHILFLPLLLTSSYLIFCVFIFPWTYRPLLKKVFDISYTLQGIMHLRYTYCSHYIFFNKSTNQPSDRPTDQQTNQLTD
jgi:hypothetical protein